MSALALAAVVAGIALGAGLVSARLGISVAAVELAGGVAVGNAIGVEPQEWLTVVAGLGGLLLSFLAGAQLDRRRLSGEWRTAAWIGLLSFSLPFLAGAAIAHWGLGWDDRASLVAGVVLSETGIAVVFALLVEESISESAIGQRVLAATLVTSFGTAVALSAVFLDPDLDVVLFTVAAILAIVAIPRMSARFVEGALGRAASANALRLALGALIVLLWLGERSNEPAALPAFLLGIAMADHFRANPLEARRFRTVTFAIFAPAFFVGIGLALDLSAASGAVGAVVLLVLVKLGSKAIGVGPAAKRALRGNRETSFMVLLLSTGLTFGAIAAVEAHDQGIVDSEQLSVLLAVVAVTAVVPTLVAQRGIIARAPWPRDPGD